MIKLIIFILIFTSCNCKSFAAEKVPHTHGERRHTHFLPPNGLNHSHSGAPETAEAIASPLNDSLSRSHSGTSETAEATTSPLNDSLSHSHTETLEATVNNKTETKYKAKYILFYAKVDATNVIKKLKDGESFEHIFQNSTFNGGLDSILNGPMSSLFKVALDEMEEGEYSEKPIASGSSWYVIKLEKKYLIKSPDVFKNENENYFSGKNSAIIIIILLGAFLIFTQTFIKIISIIFTLLTASIGFFIGGPIGIIIGGVVGYMIYSYIIDLFDDKNYNMVEVIPPPTFSLFKPYKCGGCGGSMVQVGSTYEYDENSSSSSDSDSDSDSSSGISVDRYKCKKCGALGSTYG